MYLKPCRNCPHKDGCEIKAEKLKAMRGLGITLVNFKCAKRLSTLPPGQRIELELVDWLPGHEDYAPTPEIGCATVMRPYGARILVWLDEETARRRNPIAVHPNRVTPLGTRVEICPDCGQPEGTAPAERPDGMTFHCPRCAGWELVERDGWDEWMEPAKTTAP